MFSKNAQLFSFVVHLFKNILMMTREFVHLWRKLYILLQTPLPMKLRAKDSVKKVYSCFLCCTGFFLVVQLFKNIQRRTTEFVQHWEKLYILVKTPLSIKLRAKGNVFQRCTAFFLVVQLFKNIQRRTTEFVQLWKRLYILVQTPWSMKLRAKYSVQKVCSCFLCCTAFAFAVQLFSLVVQRFKNIDMRTTEFVQLWKKLYILLQTPLSIKLRVKDSVQKVYSCFFFVVQLFKNKHMRTTEFVQLWKNFTFWYKHQCQ